MDTQTPDVTNMDVLTESPIDGNGDGLKAEYYNNKNFTSLKLSRIDTSVDFRWGKGSPDAKIANRSEEHTSELQSLTNLVCRLLLAKKNPPPPPPPPLFLTTSF